MVDPHDLSHLKRLAPWTAKANKLIDSSIEAIAALAERSLTRSVVDADEGRATLRVLAGQRSAQAAMKRLDELQGRLAGETDRSLHGLIQDARASFYHDAFPHWAGQLPKAIVDANAKPTPSGENKARGMFFEGVAPCKEIAPVFLTAKTSLQKALNAAAVKGIAATQRHANIDMWERKTADLIKAKVETILSNGQIAITNLVGPEMVKEELRKDAK